MVERAAARGWRRGWRSRLVRAILVVLGLFGALVLAGLGYELSLPSVANAPARVATIVRTHRAQLGGLPVPTKLGEAVVAVEDEHFYSNVLVNVFDGAARAALATLHTSGDPAEAPSPSSWQSSSTLRAPGSAPRWSRSGLDSSWR